jgi:surfeit locus 1 family protein
MKFRFSLPVCLIGTMLIIGFSRLSYWQWTRHLEKVELEKVVETRLGQAPVSINESPITELPEYTPVKVSGDFDFENEIVLRNRRHDEQPGVIALTPLKITGSNNAVLVSRGFIPLSHSEKSQRRQFQRETTQTILGITKFTQRKKLFAPSDAENDTGEKRLDAWLRPDIESIQKQIPYPLLPYFVEATAEKNAADLKRALFASSKGKEELLSLSLKQIPSAQSVGDLLQYPIPTVTANLPASRHFGYVFEWGFMGVMTLLICLVLQLRRNIVNAENNTP